MALMDFIKKQFIDILEWTAAGDGTLAWQGRWAWLGENLRQPKRVALFGFSALLLACNWMVYVLAVQTGHVVEASLGYFINPLVNVLLGVLVLRERLRVLQWAAVALAACDNPPP